MEHSPFTSNLNIMKVYEHIIKYYPIGIHHELPYYNNYSGIKKLKQLHVEDLALRSNEYGINLKIVFSQSLSFEPALVGCILINHLKTDIELSQNLYFYLSTIAPFYTIYGIDQIKLADERNKDSAFAPLLTISPEGVYQNIFISIKEMIEKNFKEYEFIPHRIHHLRIKGLYVSTVHRQEASIFQALFGPFLEPDLKIKGDKRYGVKEWIYKDTTD